MNLRVPYEAGNFHVHLSNYKLLPQLWIVCRGLRGTLAFLLQAERSARSQGAAARKRANRRRQPTVRQTVGAGRCAARRGVSVTLIVLCQRNSYWTHRRSTAQDGTKTAHKLSGETRKSKYTNSSRKCIPNPITIILTPTTSEDYPTT